MFIIFFEICELILWYLESIHHKSDKTRGSIDINTFLKDNDFEMLITVEPSLRQLYHCIVAQIWHFWPEGHTLKSDICLVNVVKSRFTKHTHLFIILINSVLVAYFTSPFFFFFFSSDRYCSTTSFCGLWYPHTGNH